MSAASTKWLVFFFFGYKLADAWLCSCLSTSWIGLYCAIEVVYSWPRSFFPVMLRSLPHTQRWACIEIINLSAIVIGDNLLLIIVITQNNLDLSIIDIAFVIYFFIADNLSR